MPTIEKSIEVDVPVRTAYTQWTQFEEFPRFMEGVQEVRQISDDRLHWCAEIAGRTEEWDARIIEQRPDERVAWSSEGAVINGGAVTFHKITPECTRVMLQLEYEPDEPVESASSALGFVSRQVETDLDRFKEFIESRREETATGRGIP